MAQDQYSPARPSMLDAVPVFLVLLIAAHVLGLVFWIYKLATQKQPLQRRKAH
ncbi:hypothetical protein MtrunA17_Chr3g0136731 [Medicago truncatula]|uniref:Transmembrane protein, putative n=1 Tax=Medicago truncatula TaxID=3880 RepID=A0A072V1M8_MEDTR|nr:transmembrane protein, putative [Medicago truncatula]RHN70550.1 hypothetical protein MtrunA17_Chr3g0136731 [Medicago truncatula]